MRIALAQLNYHIGNFEENTRKIIRAVEQAGEQQADLVVFAELAVCGYPPRDFLEWDEFIDRCEEATNQIASACRGIACILGTPARNPVPEGKDLFNAACFLQDGKIVSRIHKTLLPTYDVFDEYRYFEYNRHFGLMELKGQKLAVTICEDLWNIDDNPLYVASPMDELMKEGPDLMINIAASPFDYAHHEERVHVMTENCRRYKLPLFYVNHVGSQTELIFDGGSLVLNAAGEVTDQLRFFEEDLRIYETDQLIPAGRNSGHWAGSQQPPATGSSQYNSGRSSEEQPAGTSASVTAEPHIVYRPRQDEVQGSYEFLHSETAISRIHQALLLGIRDYFRKSGFSKATLGLSGGIDSAVVLALAAEALGKENVLPVLMPSEFSSGHSVDDALDMAERIDCRHEIIPIKNTYNSFLETIRPQFGDRPFDVAEENIQARIRGIIVMAMSNKFGYILLNTSNKSENAVGYGTLYGDMCGGLSVIGDVYKMQVYALARYLNRDKEIIPRNILDKAPSAELRPGQKDSDSLPDYAVLDQILYQYIELKRTTREITEQGHDEATVKKVIGLVNRNEYKRLQVPPILRVSPKAFGMGRRMPIVGKYYI